MNGPALWDACNVRFSNKQCIWFQVQSKDPWHASPLKSTSPLPSVSNISMTLCTRGFCCSSGKDMNSSTLRDPELSRSSFLNLFPSLLISSASTGVHRENNTEMDSISKHSPVWPSSRSNLYLSVSQTTLQRPSNAGRWMKRDTLTSRDGILGCGWSHTGHYTQRFAHRTVPTSHADATSLPNTTAKPWVSSSLTYCKLFQMGSHDPSVGLHNSASKP